MFADRHPSAPNSVAADLQQLLRTVSQEPWGPGRELEASIHRLHQELLVVERRLGTSAEQPDELEVARQIGHELRNKLSIFLGREHLRAAKVA
jgi:hypothetical protein